MNVKDAGVKGDGTDDTKGLQDLINNPVNYETLIFPTGTYRIDKLRISRPMCFIGIGKVIITRQSSGSIVFGNNVDNVYLENITFDGAFQPSTMVWLNALKMTVRDCTFKNNGISGFSKGRNGPTDGLRMTGKEGMVDNCLFDGNERDGLLCGAVETLKISNSKFNNNGRFACANDGGLAADYFPIYTQFINNSSYNNGSGGFVCEGIKNKKFTVIEFTNNVIDSCGYDDWGYGSGLTAGIYTQGSMVGNTIKNFNANKKFVLSAITVNTNTGGITLLGNTFENCKGIVINSIQNNSSSPITITGNTFANCGTALNAYNHHNIIFNGNSLSKMEEHGLNIDLCKNINIHGNSIMDCSSLENGKYSGVYLSRSLYPSLTCNTINSSNQKYGIEASEVNTKSFIVGLNNIYQFVNAESNF
ncbi:right-handed parallel beta-helix repeat-containing protein [Peribacillus simplex]|uniref:right-handed parallel beta-helix repeat-containing protein n=1 Tax=Peribacillus simplex TaxID=1478 RepID=UPI003D2A9116